MANAPANLNFTGIIPREDMVDYYNIADLFLLPSFEELFPMAVLEAFSTETPVMVRDLSLYEKIITPYAVMAKDVDAMQTKINQLAVDPDLLATYAKRVRQRPPSIQRIIWQNLGAVLYRTGQIESYNGFI